jgi:hypothetical protein
MFKKEMLPKKKCKPLLYLPLWAALSELRLKNFTKTESTMIIPGYSFRLR